MNIKQTKSLVFNNTGKLHNQTFNLNDTPIENTKKYTYLGIIFTNSDSFTDAKQNSYSRGLILSKIENFISYI